MGRQPVTVSKLNSYIKRLLENDSELGDVLVKGEISNFKHHYSGHMYFTLKDEDAKIKCIMFKGYNIFLKFLPEDGMNVILQGSISIYEKDGQYQLYCSKMEPDGLGSLYLAFEQLKERLFREGLFDADRKKAIPVLPGKIGVATSPTGAVIRDIINISTKRYKNVNILLYPVKVQGDGAAQSIVEAIEYFNTREDIDTIIIGRGGGSIEELWAFNEEVVARAVYSSRIPVISAVGHETDFTIADFAADARASTPSHAAEIAVPSYEDLNYKIQNMMDSIRSDIVNNFSRQRLHLRNITQIVKSNSPVNMVNQYMQYMDTMESNLRHCIENKMNAKTSLLSNLAARLDSLSPMKILSRGYAYAEQDNKVVRSINDVDINDRITVHLNDGILKCEIIEKMEGLLWEPEKNR